MRVGTRRAAMSGDNGIVRPPAGWTWALPFNIVRSGSTFSPAGFDVSAYAPTGKAYYVATDGDETADGLTPTTPFKRVRTALAKADAVVVWVKPGIYPFYRAEGDVGGWDAYNLARSCSVRRYGDSGQVILSQHDILSWSASGEYTDTYEAVRTTAVYSVRDASVNDANGDYTALTLRASVAAVDAAPGSWYDDGTKVYIRTTDSRVPDANIRPYFGTATYNALCAGAFTIYLENIEFHGGAGCIRPSSAAAAAAPTVYAKNCVFKYANSASFYNRGGKYYAQNCLAAANGGDGFSSVGYNTGVPQCVEINCISRHNGKAGDSASNGSTTHNNSSIVRLNGEYYSNYGPNIHDVIGGQSWNLGVVAHDSAQGAAADWNFAVGVDGSGGTMWCDRCRSYGSTADYVADTAATLYKRLCTGDATDAGAGAIGAY